MTLIHVLICLFVWSTTSLVAALFVAQLLAWRNGEHE